MNFEGFQESDNKKLEKLPPSQLEEIIQKVSGLLLVEGEEAALQNSPQIAKNIVNAANIGNIFIDDKDLAQTLVSASREKIFDEYSRDFLRGLEDPRRGLSVPDKDFHLSFDLESENQQNIDTDSLIDVVKDKRRVLLKGNAGGGKSGLLRKCGVSLLEQDVFPIVLNFKNWKEEYSNQLREAENKFDVLCRVSVAADINQTMLKLFPNQLILADALNEVFSNSLIYEELSEYVRNNSHHGVCVLVTDRTDKQVAGETIWTIARLNSLSQEVVEEQISNKFEHNEFEKLSKSERELLQIPFFLNIALDSESPRLGSAASAIKMHFERALNPSPDEFDNFAKAAFKAYKKERSSSFNTNDFIEEVGEDAWTRLVKSGLIIEGDFSKFDHQLKHDYLASKYLAENESEWEYDSFDAVTFKSQSFDALSMTVEQIPEPETRETFLKAIYDWNWRAPLVCLQNAEDIEDQILPDEINLVILVLSAVKLADPVVGSCQKARIELEKFTSEKARRFLDAEFNVKQEIESLESEKQWFNNWKQLFLLDYQENLTEVQIQNILSDDAIIGWTAANVIRRFTLDNEQQRQLRAYCSVIRIIAGSNFSENLKKKHQTGTILWRIVHALGMTDNEENVKLLFSILDDSGGYHWAKYGAARSIVEIAAFTKNSELRESIIGNLGERISGLQDRYIREEICNTAIYKKNLVSENWVTEFKPVIEESLAFSSKGDIETSDYLRMKKILEDFEKYYS